MVMHIHCHAHTWSLVMYVNGHGCTLLWNHMYVFMNSWYSIPPLFGVLQGTLLKLWSFSKGHECYVMFKILRDYPCLNARRKGGMNWDATAVQTQDLPLLENNPLWRHKEFAWQCCKSGRIGHNPTRSGERLSLKIWPTDARLGFLQLPKNKKHGTVPELNKLPAHVKTSHLSPVQARFCKFALLWDFSLLYPYRTGNKTHYQPELDFVPNRCFEQP